MLHYVKRGNEAIPVTEVLEGDEVLSEEDYYQFLASHAEKVAAQQAAMKIISERGFSSVIEAVAWILGEQDAT